jgi:hypothetical protein
MDSTARVIFFALSFLSSYWFKYEIYRKATDDFGYSAGELTGGGPRSRNKLVVLRERVQEWSTVVAV